jgi:hypothetical protein
MGALVLRDFFHPCGDVRHSLPVDGMGLWHQRQHKFNKGGRRKLQHFSAQELRKEHELAELTQRPAAVHQ